VSEKSGRLVTAPSSHALARVTPLTLMIERWKRFHRVDDAFTALTAMRLTFEYCCVRNDVGGSTGIAQSAGM
jgi:hypothetical protein